MPTCGICARHVVEQSSEIVRRRVDEEGVKEPTILREGDNRIIVQLPGVGDPSQLGGPHRQDREDDVPLRQRPVSPSPQSTKPTTLPPGTVALPGARRAASSRSLKRQDHPERREPGGRPGRPRSTTNEPIVTFQFDSAGARKFARATAEENVGRRFAIVLDNEVISAPVIREPIPGGRGLITGNFTAQIGARSRRAAARRRPAGAAARAREAHGRRRARRRFDRRRQARQLHGPGAGRRGRD